ncbi:MAG: peroxidase family protein [Phenylobacterium sp.]
MARIGHGDTYSPSFAGGTASIAGVQTPVSAFNFMFPALRAVPANLLPVGATTVANLKLLGAAMEDTQSENPVGNGTIPAAYTYFGQFLDHDVTLQQPGPGVPDISDPQLAPLANPAGSFTNARVPTLDLDSVYGGLAVRDSAAPDKLLVGKVSPVGQRPPNRGDFNDLPRRAANADPSVDREALTGDPRNDENLVIAQLHTAFLRAHNALVAKHGSLAKARTALCQAYQRLVLADFLPRIADPSVVNDVVQNGPKFFKPQKAADVFMPFEYSVAAYRFGHSMIREVYDYNRIFPTANFRLLFTFTALSGQLGGGVAPEFPTLPENWIIEWERFLPIGGSKPQPVRRIDTKLAEPLAHLRTITGQPEGAPNDRLATRNLLRGYLIGLPTGQAVAKAMGLTPLSGAALTAAVHPEQVSVLQTTGFDTRTPLWFYILAEAGDPNGAKGAHLGPVGSRIVVETLWNLIRFSPDSIIGANGKVTAGDPFTLSDLIILSGNGA